MKKFTLGISNNKFNSKPVRFDNSIKYQRQTVDLHQLAEEIKKGCVLTHNFKNTFDGEFVKSNITIANFEYTYLVLLDVDDCQHCMSDFLSFLDLKPSIAYTTSSNVKNVNNRFRIGYLFDKAIVENEKYKEIAKGIINYFELKIEGYKHKDNTCINASQVMFGNPNNDAEVVINDNVYSFEDFSVCVCILEREEEYIIQTQMENKNRNKEDVEKIKQTIKINDEEFINDFFNAFGSNYLPFIDKYINKYKYFDHTPLDDEDNEDIPFFKLPEEYISIKRYMCKDLVEKTNGDKKYFFRVAKIKKGSRNKLLFVASVLRKKMMPEVTFEHLLFCLCLDRQWFVDNTDKEVTNKVLFELAKNAYNSTCEIKIEKEKRKYIVNKKYCSKYNIPANSINTTIKKIMKDEEIGHVFDFSISIKENMKIMKEFGIKVSKSKLYIFYNEYSNNNNEAVVLNNGNSICVGISKKEEEYIIQTQMENNDDNELIEDHNIFNSIPFTNNELLTMFEADKNIVEINKIKNKVPKLLIKKQIEEKEVYDWEELVGLYSVV